MPLDMEAIRARADAATPGPWTWNVNPHSHTMSLDGRGGTGIEYVLGFARWGMNSAQMMLRRAVSRDGRTWHRMDKAESFAVPIPGREHHEHWARDLDHPDAQFIAHARTDVPALCARVAALEAERDGLREKARRLGRRDVAAMKVIARLYHDENGNLVRAYPDGMNEIGDILAGLCDDEIAEAIDAARDAGRARGEG